jgi:anti-anti-sigma factor
MRNSVPFIEEGHISRADSEQAGQKRQAGKLIDEVITSADTESSWEDVVPDTWQSNRTKAMKSSPGIKRLLPAQSPKQLVQGSSRPERVESSTNKAGVKPKAVAAFVDWVAINSGHGLRVNIVGNIDHNLRDQWRRLLEETATMDVNEYEINLKATPVLSMTGLGMLLLFKERKDSSREAIKLSNCNQDVWKLLNWTGMDKYFVIQKGMDSK